MKKIRLLLIMTICCFTTLIFGCSNQSSDIKESENEEQQETENPQETTEEKTILLAAAASLKNCMDDEIIPLFKEKNPDINVEATYDSSGKLQTQIEEGADVDIFMSAAMKQIDYLDDKGLILKDSIVQLLENKIVLIVPKGNELGLEKFEDITKSETVAVGDPESVPAGQYAKEALEYLKLWDEVSAKASLGTNVTEVLNWVGEGSANAGIVYSTDAASNENVQVVAEAPEGSVSKVIYPVGIVKSTKNENEAKLFAEFLSSDEVIKIFEKYGFKGNK